MTQFSIEGIGPSEWSYDSGSHCAVPFRGGSAPDYDVLSHDGFGAALRRPFVMGCGVLAITGLGGGEGGSCLPAVEGEGGPLVV